MSGMLLSESSSGKLPRSPESRGAGAGFTLVEIAASVVILAMIVIPLLGARNRTIAAAAKSSMRLTAVQLAASKLSELATVPLGEIESSGTFEDAPSYTWSFTVEVEEAESYGEDVSGDEEIDTGAGTETDTGAGTEAGEEVEIGGLEMYRVKLDISFSGYTGGEDGPVVTVSTLVLKLPEKKEEDVAETADEEKAP